MKLVILSRGRSLYSTRRLGLAGLARGHDVRLVDPLSCALLLEAGRGDVLVAGEPLGHVDAVIARVGSGTSMHGLAVLRQIELSGAYCLNRSTPTAHARDKLRTLQLLAQRGIGIVRSALARGPSQVRDAVARLGGPPCVVKFSDGAQGTGVMLVESLAAAESVIDAFVCAHRHLLLQEFVPDAVDLRLFVVGRKVVAAMRRIAREGSFRANIHQGGAAVAHTPTEEQARVALAAAHAVGLEMAGVDLLETPAGPLVLEINASPGLEGIESASGQNVACAVYRFLERKVQEHVETAGAGAGRS